MPTMKVAAAAVAAVLVVGALAQAQKMAVAVAVAVAVVAPTWKLGTLPPSKHTVFLLPVTVPVRVRARAR